MTGRAAAVSLKRMAMKNNRAAESLFAAGKYDWCLFLGHLVLEKTLKAILVQKQGEKIQPKTHNPVKLTEKSSLE